MQFISGLPIHEDIYNILLDIQTEVQTTGLPLLKDVKLSGDNVMVTCPIHKDGMESKPSCGVATSDVRRGNTTVKAGTVNCFTCGYVASMPEFISHVFGYNDAGKYGFKWLSRKYQYVDVEERKPVQIVKPKEEEQERQYVSEEELDKLRYYHPYMGRRGLVDEWVEYFDVGYDKETDSITFPVNDAQGRCLFIQKRSVQGKNFDNDTNANKDTLYGLDKLYDVIKMGTPLTEVYIVESPIDTITVWQWGGYALGTMQAIPTKEQLEILNKLPVKTLIAAQDNDRAGDVGATRLRDKTNKLVKRLIFPEGVKDINEMTPEQYYQAERSIAFKSVRSMK